MDHNKPLSGMTLKEVSAEIAFLKEFEPLVKVLQNRLQDLQVRQNLLRSHLFLNRMTPKEVLAEFVRLVALCKEPGVSTRDRGKLLLVHSFLEGCIDVTRGKAVIGQELKKRKAPKKPKA